MAKANTKKSSTKKNSRKVKEITRVAVVIDRSDSMRSILVPTRNGLSEQITAIRQNAKKCDETYVTIISFDHEIVVHENNVNVNDLSNINPEAIVVPRGMTAMNDAIMKAIEVLQGPKKTKGTGYLVIVLSDGWENASKTSSAAVSSHIKELEATGQWTFTFMLSNQDIHVVAKKYNLDMGNMAAFTSTTLGTTQAFNTMVNSTVNYFHERSRGLRSVKTFYNNNDTLKDEDNEDVVV